MSEIPGPQEEYIAMETEALDQVWFDKLQEILSSDDTQNAYIPDSAQLAEEKALFIEEKVQNPHLLTPNLDPEKLRHRDSELMALKNEIIREEKNETIRQLYRWRINEKIAEVRMYQASLNGDIKRFDRYNEFIYGEPSKEIFEDIISCLREEIIKDLRSNNPELVKAGKKLLAFLPEVNHKELEKPSSDTFVAVRQSVEDEINGFDITLPETEEKIGAEDIAESFRESLEKIGAKGWAVIVDTSARRLITIDQASKTIYIPQKREVSLGKLESLTVHEILTHALRGVTGEKTGLKLASIGLDRYERAEEGVATARTQSQEESFEGYASSIDYLAIGLAKGLDGKTRDFRGVYEILKQYNYYKNIKKGQSHEVAQEKAETSAWNTSRMNFRGTDFRTLGICNREKIMYREGNIEVWMQLGNNPDLMQKCMISLGKIDTNNTRHLYALYQLRIISKEELDHIEAAITKDS